MTEIMKTTLIIRTTKEKAKEKPMFSDLDGRRKVIVRTREEMISNILSDLKRKGSTVIEIIIKKIKNKMRRSF